MQIFLTYKPFYILEETILHPASLSMYLICMMTVQVSELRASVSRCEQQSAWREERMKQEVSDVQQRLQEAEMRNQELTTTISQSEPLT